MQKQRIFKFYYPQGEREVCAMADGIGVKTKRASAMIVIVK